LLLFSVAIYLINTSSLVYTLLYSLYLLYLNCFSTKEAAYRQKVE
jgi:hypothetical protein